MALAISPPPVFPAKAGTQTLSHRLKRPVDLMLGRGTWKKNKALTPPHVPLESKGPAGHNPPA
jgi:hypothetical protein